MTYKRAAACVSKQALDEAFQALMIDLISKTILQSSLGKPHFMPGVTAPQASVCTPAHIHEFALTTHIYSTHTY